ncbi:MAG: holin [Candidatus Nanopelagicales bacterium]|nr:holin [Candidatus Nanopelagicales bacterium]
MSIPVEARAVIERAVKTAAQTAVATIGTAAVLRLQDVDWVDVGSISAVAAILSVLTSVASWEVGAPGPSLGVEEITPPDIPSRIVPVTTTGGGFTPEVKPTDRESPDEGGE